VIRTVEAEQTRKAARHTGIKGTDRGTMDVRGKKNKNSRKRRAMLGILIFIACVTLVLAGVTTYIWTWPKPMIVSEADAREAQCAIVPGSHVIDGVPSNTLADRLIVAKRLYDAGKVKKILVSGDHGQDNYDEANTMRNYLLDRGVPPEDIFMDHAGFDTYQTMYRAKEVFEVETAIIVTQDFHLPRSLFIASNLGMDVQGVDSALRNYQVGGIYWLREIPATWKAFWQVYITQPLPKYLGDAIPISGDGQSTKDESSQ
jgi:SanA protein